MCAIAASGLTLIAEPYPDLKPIFVFFGCIAAVIAFGMIFGFGMILHFYCVAQARNGCAISAPGIVKGTLVVLLQAVTSSIVRISLFRACGLKSVSFESVERFLTFSFIATLSLAVGVVISWIILAVLLRTTYRLAAIPTVLASIPNLVLSFFLSLLVEVYI